MITSVVCVLYVRTHILRTPHLVWVSDGAVNFQSHHIYSHTEWLVTTYATHQANTKILVSTYQTTTSTTLLYLPLRTGVFRLLVEQKTVFSLSMSIIRMYGINHTWEHVCRCCWWKSERQRGKQRFKCQCSAPVWIKPESKVFRIPSRLFAHIHMFVIVCVHTHNE